MPPAEAAAELRDLHYTLCAGAEAAGHACRHHEDGAEFLPSGQQKRLAQLDALTVPTQMPVGIDPEQAEPFDRNLANLRRPAGGAAEPTLAERHATFGTRQKSSGHRLSDSNPVFRCSLV